MRFPDTDPEAELEAIAALEDALEQPSARRADFLRTHATLSASGRKRALQLLEFQSSNGNALITGGASIADDNEALPEKIGSYQVLRLIGRGGMGNVYLAERAEKDFDLAVAIKVIKQRLITPNLVERFRSERQILADLNHPNIARLFDGGETEAGAPFFVMEFVDGQSLDRWLESEERSLADRISVFRQVCGAVQAAHQRLIVHRDLTPPNVLVTELGVAKVIDFGIARSEAPEGDASAATSDHTPGFAAPEQREGAAPSTLSDVYALGKLLELLTQDEDSPELLAIARKASSDSPADRYQSVSTLIEDIENYTGNRPVAAMDGGLAYVASKLVKRQTRLVAVSAASLLALVAAFLLTLQAYHRAEAAQAQAEQNLAETRSLAVTMLFDVYDEISRSPGSAAARVTLAEIALERLDALASDENASVELRIEAGLAYVRLGQALGTRTGGNNLGELAAGQVTLDQALVRFEELYGQYPERADVQLALGQTLALMAGELLLKKSDPDRGLLFANRAIELLETETNRDEEALAALVLAYRYQAEGLSHVPDIDSAGRALETALALAERFSEEIPESLPLLRAEAEARQTYAGYLYYFEGQPESGLQMFEQSLSLRRQVAEASQDAPEDIHNLLMTLYYLGLTESEMGINQSALVHVSEAYDLAQEQRRLNPDSRPQDAILVAMQMLYGVTLSAQGRHEEAQAMADRSIALTREGLGAGSEIDPVPINFAVRLHQAAQIYAAAGQEQQACAAMRESVVYMREFDTQFGLPDVNRTEDLEPMLAALSDC